MMKWFSNGFPHVFVDQRRPALARAGAALPQRPADGHAAAAAPLRPGGLLRSGGREGGDFTWKSWENPGK